MSALIKSLNIVNRINKNPAAVYTLVRNAGGWNKDFKPAPYPETEEERRAAAKKYGLLPEEYKPYPPDLPYGDYPHLEDKPIEQKDVYYPYDHPEYRRNFQEPVHAEIDFYDETRAGLPGPLRVPIWEMWLWFLGCIGGTLALYWWLEDKKMFRPAMPKQLPRDSGKNYGGKHYTFEPAR
ncbi:NADH dehydrogenase [ubiquinone] 1 beta subcomplex subunit 8, mitochondrial [Sitodiplosis mosellana]|uniref:NADH dehydrogenase [ubiquinone] 1 beta subcomplex subunit 8, mitochondrial n=1 Tax=Sitodiplosis mosellana TaxID=263140 RepID=UPI002443B619|nr:NADH dehydrogenase [ubiquinone] 1 beta subcomplex subunit 8, mitochondrial [Sitodiplosis mosellana]